LALNPPAVAVGVENLKLRIKKNHYRLKGKKKYPSRQNDPAKVVIYLPQEQRQAST
jgi:hypothetical protein